MKNILKLGILTFAFGFIFVSANTVNAQRQGRRTEARREYREDVRDARQDYRRRVNNGDYRKARREYREDIHDARRDYRRDTGRRVNRGYYGNRNRQVNRGYNVNRNRRVYTPNVRYYYRNGRRYVVRY